MHILGKELDLGYGLSMSPVNSDEEGTSDLSLASLSLHIFPKLNLPVSFDFGGGLGFLQMKMMQLVCLPFYP